MSPSLPLSLPFLIVRFLAFEERHGTSLQLSYTHYTTLRLSPTPQHTR